LDAASFFGFLISRFDLCCPFATMASIDLASGAGTAA
jgi:hypothetical protein